MYFGLLRNTENEWGFDVSDARFSSSIKIEKSEHIRLINEATTNNKLIRGDKDGKPILVDLPEQTEEEKKRQRIIELEKFLSETDWYAIRFADTGEEIPAKIKKSRQDARDEISELRNTIINNS